MAVFRVERNTGYTVMSNHHLRNKELSLGTVSHGWRSGNRGVHGTRNIFILIWTIRSTRRTGAG